MRVMMNAFFAAAAAEGRLCQNPISRYDDRPTSSQNTYICTMLDASTNPIIEALNSDM